MSQISAKTLLILRLLRHGELSKTAAMIRQKMWSTEYSICYRRDTFVDFCAPAASRPIHVRTAEWKDLRELLNLDEPGLSTNEYLERSTRLRLFDAGIPTCFVAVTDGERPCYVQWLIKPCDNDKIKHVFHNLFPPLAADEYLLEAAYTPESFRGQRIMPAAMALLAERAGALGARYAVTYVGETNVPSRKGCQRAGFYPSQRKRAQWRVGTCRTTLLPLETAD